MKNDWFLEASSLEGLKTAYTAAQTVTASERVAFEARLDEETAPGILQVAGDKAVIPIQGVLTKRPDWMARYFGEGNTAYSEIKAALAVAADTQSVKEVTLAISSGGGQISGLFDLLAAIENFPKPIVAKVEDICASAAYAIAAQADRIEVTNRADRVGSIGIAASVSLPQGYVDIASTHAPNKRPDASTEEGQAIIRAELDGIEEVFIASIAEGRKVDVATIHADFGRGGTLLAEEAIKVGMIDAIASSVPGTTINAKKMNIDDLKANHADLYNQVVALGAAQERDRVNAHIVMGEATGAFQLACKAIKEGSGMTETYKAEYAVAGMTRSQLDAQAEDGRDTAATENLAAAKETEKKSDAEKVFEAFQALKNREDVI